MSHKIENSEKGEVLLLRPHWGFWRKLFYLIGKGKNRILKKSIFEKNKKKKVEEKVEYPSWSGQISDFTSIYAICIYFYPNPNPFTPTLLTPINPNPFYPNPFTPTPINPNPFTPTPFTPTPTSNKYVSY